MMNYIWKKMNNKKGFTLIELVVVIAILGILAAIAVPRLLGFQQRAREQADKQTAVQVRNAVALLHSNGELFPEDATGTTFTMDNTGALTYTVNTFYEEYDNTTAISDTDAEALITGLTGVIELQGDKEIQIEVGPDGEVQQSLVGTP